MRKVFLHLLAGTHLLTLATAFQLPQWFPFVPNLDPHGLLSIFSSYDKATLALPPTGGAQNESENAKHRIAIVGAGAAGSSAAFWIAKAKERYPELLGYVQVDVFEKSSLIGGRSTVVYPHDDPSYEPVELGASIFVKANKNLWRATDEFGLERVGRKNSKKDGSMNREPDDEDEDETGIWDGSEFLFRMGGGRGWLGGWWDSIRVMWRYGYKAPTKTQALVNDLIKNFLTLYTPAFGSQPWHNISEVSDRLGYNELVAQRASELLDGHGIDRKWTRELVDAATRVNYGQDVNKIHALEGLVSLAASGAVSVKGGNYQIFENFLRYSNATIHLNTTVKAISKDASTGLWTLRGQTATVSTKTGKLQTIEFARHYRGVILATPYHSSSISLTYPPASPSLSSKIPIPPQPYIPLHVTLLTTPSESLNPSYFGLSPGAKVPRTILTSADGVRRGRVGRVEYGKDVTEDGDEGKKWMLEFNSLAYNGKVKRRPTTPSGAGVPPVGDFPTVPIPHSGVDDTAPLDDDADFDADTDASSMTNDDTSSPLPPPTTQDEPEPEPTPEPEVTEYVVKFFSPQPLSDEWLHSMFGGEDNVTWVHRRVFDAYPVSPPVGDMDAMPAVKLAGGAYYVNAFEPFISTMETETIASRNVVSLLLDELFDAAICKPSSTSSDFDAESDIDLDIEIDVDAAGSPEQVVLVSGKGKGGEKVRVVDENFVYGWDC